MISNLQRASIVSDTPCHISNVSLGIVLRPAVSANMESGSTQCGGVTGNGMKATLQAEYTFYAIH